MTLCLQELRTNSLVEESYEDFMADSVNGVTDY